MGHSDSSVARAGRQRSSRAVQSSTTIISGRLVREYRRNRSPSAGTLYRDSWMSREGLFDLKPSAIYGSNALEAVTFRSVGTAR